jgi:acetylornithine deacetylase
MDGFKTDRNYPAIEVMENAFADAMGREAIIAGFKPLCDGTFINPYVPCVVFGPQPAGTHGRDERITLQEVLDCAKVFASTIIDWCSKDKK